jgi:hypothetical protein
MWFDLVGTAKLGFFIDRCKDLLFCFSNMYYHKEIFEIIIQAIPLLRELTPKEFMVKPAPDKWAKSEILGHLVDSAFVNFQRFVSVGHQNELIFPTYDQDHWVRRNNYIDYGTNDLIQIWANVNSHLGELLENIPDEILYRKTTKHNFDQICFNRIDSKTPSSLNYLIWDYLDHMEHHLDQIILNYKKVGTPYVDHDVNKLGHPKSDT